MDDTWDRHCMYHLLLSSSGFERLVKLVSKANSSEVYGALLSLHPHNAYLAPPLEFMKL